MVSACLPQARHFLKHLSRLNATRGKYPKSSKSVNKGKKIAIGGSMTDTTQAVTRYAPVTSIPESHAGAPANRRRSGASRLKRSAESHWEG